MRDVSSSTGWIDLGPGRGGCCRGIAPSLPGRDQEAVQVLPGRDQPALHVGVRLGTSSDEIKGVEELAVLALVPLDPHLALGSQVHSCAAGNGEANFRAAVERLVLWSLGHDHAVLENI